MGSTKKSQDDLKQEIAALRQRVAELEAAGAEHRCLEAALRASEERLRIINESAFDYAFSFRINDQGILFLEWLTNNFTQITGYAAEKLIGKPNPLQQYIHPEDLPRVIQTIRTLTAEYPTEYEFRIITHDGSIKWLRSRARARVGHSGQPIRIDGATQDITERKHIEEALNQSEERFTLFLQHLPGIAFIKDLDGHYVFVNETLEKLFPDNVQGWIGRTDHEIFPVHVAEQSHANDQRVVTSGQGIQRVETLPQRDGLHQWLVSKFPIVDPWGIPVMLGGIGIDVTKRQ